jgi:pSer/pThr/pTyr-binding forkhead associated (FHA) protein
MALTVLVRSGDANSPPQISFDAPRIVIGRGEGCELRLPDPSVSHRHASIRQRGTDYIIVDEGSTNGTFAGPVRLSPQAPRVLKSGDLIRVGRIWLEVRVEHAVLGQNPQLATKEIALRLVADALAAQGETASIEVRVSLGPDAGQSLAVQEFERPYVIGRGKDSDLALEDDDASRRHVELRRRGDQLLVRDLGSKNGSKLGELTLDPKKEQAWPRGTLLELGGNKLSYEDPVFEALLELERSADEQMRDDESIEPPPAEEPVSGEPLLEQAAFVDSSHSSPLEAPIPSVPRRKRAHSDKRRLRITDIVVAGLALLVLAASVLGLLWLFRSE